MGSRGALVARARCAAPHPNPTVGPRSHVRAVAPHPNPTAQGAPPPLPVLRWAFDPTNTVLNDNARCHVFGNIGLPYADRHRKEILGTALGITVISIVVTIVGCFGALATDPTTVALTHWVRFDAAARGGLTVTRRGEGTQP